MQKVLQTQSSLTSDKDTGFKGEGPEMGVGGMIPYHNRVFGGVPGVLESAYYMLNTCTVVLYTSYIAVSNDIVMPSHHSQ